MEIPVKILSAEYVTHNVRRFRLERPEGYVFVPGQATELSVDKDGWRELRNPFTFTCLEDAPYLEFTIKIYPDHEEGVTRELSKLNAGDTVILREPWGAISYKGPGYFIAGGAGITPFLAILRMLHRRGEAKQSKLFYSNQTDKDIILIDELKEMLGDNAHFCITRQPDTIHNKHRIDSDFLLKEIPDFNTNFYVCGPDPMVLELTATLEKLGAKTDALVFEK